MAGRVLMRVRNQRMGRALCRTIGTRPALAYQEGKLMAGSYNHAVADDGQLLNNLECVGMAAENGGDAFETIEEMYGMIWWLAQAFPNPAGAVEQARQYYKDGLAASPGTNGTNPREDDDE